MIAIAAVANGDGRALHCQVDLARKAHGGTVRCVGDGGFGAVIGFSGWDLYDVWVRSRR